MKRITLKFALLLYLMCIVTFYSCEKEETRTPTDQNIEMRDSGNNNEFSSSTSIVSGCEDCDPLLENQSFEDGNVTVPGNNQFINGEVPSWISISGTPDINHQNDDLLGEFESLNGSYDSNQYAFLYVLKIGAFYGTECIAQSYDFYNDSDLEYCIDFVHATQRAIENGVSPSLQVYLSNDVPQDIDLLNNDLDISLYDNKKIISILGDNTWTNYSTTFISDISYNQISIIPEIDTNLNNAAGALVIDNINVSCATDALVGIDYTYLNGILSLTAIFEGLPDHVDIRSYSWSGNGGNISDDANPNLAIPEITQPLSVCLDIIDSRSCCASICDTIIIETGCAEYICNDRFGNSTLVEDCASCPDNNENNDFRCVCEPACSVSAALSTADPCDYDGDELENVSILGSATAQCPSGSTNSNTVFDWYKDGALIETGTSLPQLNLDNNDYRPAWHPDGPNDLTPKYGSGNGEYYFIARNSCCPGVTAQSNSIMITCF